MNYSEIIIVNLSSFHKCVQVLFVLLKVRPLSGEKLVLHLVILLNALSTFTPFNVCKFISNSSK